MADQISRHRLCHWSVTVECWGARRRTHRLRLCRGFTVSPSDGHRASTGRGLTPIIINPAWHRSSACCLWCPVFSGWDSIFSMSSLLLFLRLFLSTTLSLFFYLSLSLSLSLSLTQTHTHTHTFSFLLPPLSLSCALKCLLTLEVNMWLFFYGCHRHDCGKNPWPVTTDALPSNPFASMYAVQLNGAMCSDTWKRNAHT